MGYDGRLVIGAVAAVASAAVWRTWSRQGPYAATTLYGEYKIAASRYNHLPAVAVLANGVTFQVFPFVSRSIGNVLLLRAHM